MKSLFVALFLACFFLISSCQENTDNAKKETDSVHSGLEGTREQASQLSNATIDTSAGKSVKKSDVKDSVK